MKRVIKPWGEFLRFTLNERSTVKIINVKPHQVLSLQYHHNRKEMWYFLTEGYVQIGEKKRKVKEGEIVNVEKGQIHRIFSKGKRVRVLEIAEGKFNEKDIVRLKDKYGRV